LVALKAVKNHEINIFLTNKHCIHALSYGANLIDFWRKQ